MAQNKDLALSAAEARAIAKDTFIYSFPIAANYQTMHKQAIDSSSPDYRASFNTLTNSKSVATPDDKFVVTPNSDTPYSYLWMDLRAEPLVVTIPRIEPNRYYTGQMIDLYTYNFAYLGTRAYGNDGGDLPHRRPRMERRPNHLTSKPSSTRETQFAYLLFRTQLFNTADLPNVNNIQAEYHVQPLSTFTKQSAPPAAPASQWPKTSRHRHTLASHLPHRQLHLPVLPAQSIRKRRPRPLRKLNIGPNQTFDITRFSPEIQQAINDGINDSNADLDTVMKKINSDQISSGDMFGTRDFLKDNYLYRYAEPS